MQSIGGSSTTFTWDVAAWQYPLADGLGSVRQWTNASRQVTYAARYAPFGETLWQQGTAPSPWSFAGEMQDPTGLIYLRARWKCGAKRSLPAVKRRG